MLTLYGIKNCDTVKRARKALQDADIPHRFHDFRTDGIDAAKIQSWIDKAGLDTLLNKRGTTWRKLSDDEQARADAEPAKLLEEHPAAIKRPVFVDGDDVLVGFGKKDEDEILAQLVKQ